MRVADDGYGLAEAIVALAIAGVAFAGVAGTARVATVALRRAAASQRAAAGAAERVEALRAGPPETGADVLPGLPPVARVWGRAAGRGRPDRLAAEASCDGTRVTLDSAVWP